MKQWTIGIGVLFFLAVAGSAQSLNLKAGIFYPQQHSDLWDINTDNLTGGRADMLNAYYGVEYENPVGRYATIAFEIGNYSRTRYAEYVDFEHQDGSPINQSFSLKMTPIEATLRLYPNGHRRVFCPYVGVGVALYAWTYEQWGEFINQETWEVTEGSAETRSVAVGFTARAGFLFRVRRNIGFSIEGKYNYAKGRLSDDFQDFELFDLSGFTATAGLNFYFD